MRGGLNDYERKLLSGWEEVHKKSQLSLWILVALKAGPKHMTEIKAHISRRTNGTISADDQSMYRALRRFHDAEMIQFTMEPSESGPDLKVYRLTKTGKRLLEEFIERNIIQVFYDPKTQHLLLK